MRVKPWKGRYVSRKKAKQINDMLLATQKTYHTELKREAEEFIEYIKSMREESI